MDKRLLELLCCPVTTTPVRLLVSAELDALNQAVVLGRAVTAAGNPVSRTFSEGLITQDNKCVYRVEDGIPVMLADERINVVSVEGFALG